MGILKRTTHPSGLGGILLKSLALAFAMAGQALATKPAHAADLLDASYSPPGGLSVEEAPQFVVLGFDDNRYIDGMQWVMDLLEGKKNPAGKGNPSTFDGQPIKAAFYFTSGAAMADAGKPADVAYKADLLKLWKRAVAGGHEVANHTHTHETSNALSKDKWVSEMRECTKNLVALLGIDASEIWGFRTPYLDFGQGTFDAIKEVGLLYEATVTHQGDYNKRQHVWPYTLDKGFNERSIAPAGWIYPGVWEIPVYTTSVDITGHPPVTGFDSSILTQAYGDQYAGMLKMGLDYRLTPQGNRAPYTVGLHSDTYSDENASAKINYDPRMGLADRRKALSDFIEYALTKPNVRFVSAKQLIQWMRKPVGLSTITPVAAKKTKARFEARDLIRVKADRISFTLPPGGDYVITAVTVRGREAYRSGPIRSGSGETVTLDMSALPKGVNVLRMDGAGASFRRAVVVP
jgi:hypothetical protein